MFDVKQNFKQESLEGLEREKGLIVDETREL